MSNQLNNRRFWYDKAAKPIAEFITSTLFVSIVMLVFMGGIVSHLAIVFDSWFLAAGFQCVVIIASVNADILPKITLAKTFITGKGYVATKTLPAIAVIMSIFMFWFISISFGIVEAYKQSNWTQFTIVLTKSFAVAAMELMFSYLFTYRWHADLKRFAGLKTDLDKAIIQQTDDDEIAQFEREKRLAELQHEMQEYRQEHNVSNFTKTKPINRQIKTDNENNGYL